MIRRTDGQTVGHSDERKDGRTDVAMNADPVLTIFSGYVRRREPHSHHTDSGLTILHLYFYMQRLFISIQKAFAW